jgi:NAD(P)H-hydrate repair Nnr-like enzyme with NAD(P)H-hydrate dehydratase domain
VTPADAALVFGHALAMPFTLFVPGFLRVWRRREPELFLTAQAGAALITAGWLAKGDAPAAAVNAAWLVGFGIAYTLAGRRTRTA